MITLRNGVWWSDYYEADKRIRKSLKTSDKKEAMTKVVAMMQKKEEGIPLEAAYKAAKEGYKGWRDSKSPETIEGNWKAVQAYFGPCSLSSVNIQKYTTSMLEAGQSGSTINQRLSLISILFKHTGLPRPPIHRVRTNPGRTRRVTTEEELKLLKLFAESTRPKGKDMHDLVVFLLDTGMRLSEALNVEFDLERRVINCWVNKGDRPRAILMTDKVFTLLQRRGSNPFKMFTKDSAENEWDWVRQKMGLQHDKEFVLHILRHTVGSRLADEGVDGFVIQHMLGHASITTTQKYVHMSTKGMEKAVAALQKRDQDVTKTGRRERRSLDSIRLQATRAGLLIRRS